MKKIYDKVLLLLGIVVLGLGVGFVFSKGGIPVLVSPKVAMPSISGKEYAAIPTPPVSDSQPEWSSPDSQPDSGWTYYVFTPPKIYWSESGHIFTAKQISTELLPPYGLLFVGIKQEKYRLQFNGKTGDGDDMVFSFEDTDSGHIDVLKKGETSQDLQLKLIDYKAGSETVDGLSLTNPSVTIQDLHDNSKQVVLYYKETAFIPGKQYMQMETESPLTVKSWRVTKAGDSLTLDGKDTGNASIPSIEFDVTNVNFNFDNPTVTVVKQFLWKGKVRHDPLVLTNSEPSELPSK